MVNTNSVLSSILFSQTIDWNIKQFFSSTSINSSFELKRIGKAITRRKDQMVVEDDKRYKRITIKTNCGGVFVRDEVLGKDIKTKKQYYVKAGQLAVSKIDARNGAFGIVPPEADGAIITGNFWVYDVNPEIANIDYLILLLSYAMTKESIFDTYGVRVFEDFAAMKNFYMFADAKFLNNKPEEFNYYEKQLFDYFVQAYMPKGKKVIKNIELIYNGFSAKDLSEGEKKLILIRSVLSFVADENSLILFDEPDANIHEGRKQQIYNLFAEYCKFDRQMVVATHSPILAQLANEKELLMLDHEGGKSTLLTEEKIDKIKHLTGTSWDVIGQGMMLKSNRPLVVFEGKTDVKYVKRAIDLLKNDNPSYDQLQVDFMSAGGADNMQFFITDLLEVIPNSKKVIVFFDRDNEGQTGAATLLNLTTSDETIAHYDDVKQNNLTVSFIPYKTGVTGGDFLIEDYFSWDKTVKPMVDKAIENSHHPFKNLPKLSSRIKKGLEDKHMTFAKEEFEGFITLLDKIVKLSTEEGT